MNLTTKEKVYPNGQRYLDIFIDKYRIGSVDIVDGGYLPFGKRKPRATLEGAARSIIDTKLGSLKVELQRWQAWSRLPTVDML